MDEAIRLTDSHYCILGEISYERRKQDIKWGEQNHPCLYALENMIPERMAYAYAIPAEEVAKANCDNAAKEGRLTWAHIAIEELCESICEFDRSKRRVELIQLAAVITGWIECIDRQVTKEEATFGDEGG